MPKDWSFVAWGEHSQVYVYNADGSQSAHWSRSPTMMKFGPDNRPDFSTDGKKKIKMPNRAKPPAKVEKPLPKPTPDPPKQHPERRMAEWAATVANSKDLDYATERVKNHLCRVFKNNSPVERNRSNLVTGRIKKKIWDAIEDDWMYSDGGFDLATVTKTPLDADHYTITFNLGPKQAFGYVLPIEAKDWMDNFTNK